MTAHFGRFVAYYRVSTIEQGRSGLGLEAQKSAVEQRLNGGPRQLVGEFIEVESGQRAKRPQLEAALAACKKQKAKLVVAKLDRLSRNTRFLLTPHPPRPHRPRRARSIQACRRRAETMQRRASPPDSARRGSLRWR
jgi:hypothetical protein